MSRVKDLWFSEVPVRDEAGKSVKGPDGRVIRERKKTRKHPDNGGSKNAKRWLAIWENPDGEEETKAFRKQADAKNYGEKQEADADRGEYVKKDAGKVRFDEIARRWLRLRSVTSGTRDRYESAYRIHVEPVFGKRPVAAIRVSEIVEWLQEGPVSKLGDSTKEIAYFVLAGALELAVADQLRRDNPARHEIVPAPHVELSEREPWPEEMVFRVRDEHPEPYRAIFDCEVGLGLRRGCAFALSPDDFAFDWDEYAAGDVDESALKVTVQRQIAWVRGWDGQKGQWVFKLPKFGKSRTVPVPRGVAASLQAHMAKYPPVKVTLPWMDEKGNLGEPVTVLLLFTWRGGHGVTGKPRIRESTFGKEIRAGTYDHAVWKPALSRAGILPPPVKDKRGTSWVYLVGDKKGNGQHALRHFYQVTLEDAGVSLAARIAFMGHSKKGRVVTIESYGHVTEKQFERARQAVDATLFPLRPVGPRKSSGTIAELRAAGQS